LRGSSFAFGQRSGARIVLGRPRRRVLVTPEEAFHLRRRNVPPAGSIVLEGVDLLGGLSLGGMGRTGHQAATFVSNSSTSAPKSSSIIDQSRNSANAQRPKPPSALTPGTQRSRVV